MGVRQFGGHVKLEVIVVRDHCVSQLDHKAALLLEGLANKDQGHRV